MSEIGVQGWNLNSGRYVGVAGSSGPVPAGTGLYVKRTLSAIYRQFNGKAKGGKMNNQFSEDALVEQPAIALFAGLWVGIFTAYYP